MAQLLEPSHEELQEGEEFANLEEQPQIPEKEQSDPLEPTTEAELPDKYRDKNIKDIVQMHQEAEKLLGRQSSEVGELRKIVDDFVKTQIQAATSPQQTKGEEFDFFTDPDKAVANAIENHPKFKEAEQTSLVIKQQQIIGQLQQNHPDFVDIVQNNKFKEWIDKSKVRTELFARADQNFDYDSADELLTTWKERQNMVQETAKVQEEDRKRQLKAASTGNATGSSEAPSRKTYRRADIIKLMQTDPKRYNQLSDEIMLAYQEGRVK